MEEQQVKPFGFISQVDIWRFFDIIRREHPQTIALVLSYIGHEKASVIIQNLPNDLQSEVLRRIAAMNMVSAEVVADIEQVLKEELTASPGGYLSTGGLESTVEIIKSIDRVSEKRIIEALEDENPDLAIEIIKRMFVFEDIVMLDDRAIQKILRECDSQEIAMSLKNASADVPNKVFRNMSRRAAKMLKEYIDYMGPVRLRDVEIAQQKVLSIALHLEMVGEIIVPRSGEDELVGGYIEPEFKWGDLLSISNDDINRVLAVADYRTLLKSLKTARPEMLEKFASAMGLFKRLKLKRDIRRLKKINADDAAAAKEKIISIFLSLPPSENAQAAADNTEIDDD
jgi:flagellar motor switch protein FliG